MAKAVCDRCGKETVVTSKSFFIDETIYLDCLVNERKLREQIRQKLGSATADLKYQNCGHIPDIEQVL